MNKLQEIQALVQKGAKKLDAFFYAGVLLGMVMGPLVILVAIVPGIRNRLGSLGETPGVMLAFGVGMTVLLGWACIEQWVKVNKDQRLLALIGENPQQIVKIFKETRAARVRSTHQGFAHFAYVNFHLQDGTQTKIWLDAPDAERLITLLTTEPWGFCPYCVTPIKDSARICAACGEDVTRDAPLEMTLKEYRTAEKKTCQHCGKEMLSSAVRCANCREKS